MTPCFCTLAIHAPYRQRARLLCADAPGVPWRVLTDDPAAFADLPVRAVRHAPTGPMAVDYLARIPPTGGGNGAAAYHDKRFALLSVLREFDTAIFLDADSRLGAIPPLGVFPAGLSVLPVVRTSVAEHLEACGQWRMAAFVELARHLTGSSDILQRARWCHETCIAATKDGSEAEFIGAWGRAAEFLQARGVYSGEGGVVGLAAAFVGWTVDYEALAGFTSVIEHEGAGPKGT
jgi:hypothetical protein